MSGAENCTMKERNFIEESIRNRHKTTSMSDKRLFFIHKTEREKLSHKKEEKNSFLRAHKADLQFCAIKREHRLHAV